MKKKCFQFLSERPAERRESIIVIVITILILIAFVSGTWFGPEGLDIVAPAVAIVSCGGLV